MKLHQKILIKTLVGIVVFPAIAFGSSFVSSLIQGKTPEEAVQILAEQIDSLVEKVNVLEIMQSKGDLRIEVLEAGFKNIDEFRKRYEKAKEICEASDEELKEKVFEMVKWGDPCRTEDGYNEIVFTRPEEFRQKYPNKVEDYHEGEIYYCPKCIDYVMAKPGAAAEEMLRCVTSEDINQTTEKRYVILESKSIYESRNGQKIWHLGCLPENTYNETVFSTPEEWRQKYSEKIGSYRCDPQKLNEMIAGYRENESYDQGVGGCNLAEKYKELYQSVMESGL